MSTPNYLFIALDFQKNVKSILRLLNCTIDSKSFPERMKIRFEKVTSGISTSERKLDYQRKKLNGHKMPNFQLEEKLYIYINITNPTIIQERPHL